MPNYEYQCDACGSVFEVRQRFADQPLTVHENCGGAVHRLLSAPALQFKGSGWYVTDYARSGSSGPSNGGKNEGSESSGSKGENSKSENSKSENKTKSENKGDSKGSTSSSSSSSSDKR